MLLASSVCVIGCQHDRDDNDMSDEPKRMSMDVCPQCPGTQTATADGKCPACNMAVKTNR